MTDIERMKELVAQLDAAARAYYQEDREIMSNLEYDALYDELLALEEKLGTVMAKSPTNRVGYEILSELPKVPHDSPMLSLDKTKSPEALRDWLHGQIAMLSWKMDGLTVVITYRNGVLDRAVTRGNGVIGEVITNNARVFKNLPARIPYLGELVIRGEAVIRYSDFEKINASIEDVASRYKNPRNLCSGTVRQLNNKITADRNVYFYAFSMVSATGEEKTGGADKVNMDSMEARQIWLHDLGFDTVDYRMVTEETILEAIKAFSDAITENDFPSDGLVLIYDDIPYGLSLGTTAKFPRNAIAFKWADEEAETILRSIEWSPSRTGLINPIAIFDPVELEGTTVSRASLHNLSYMDELKLGIGDSVKVYKANMIIPQISENLTMRGGYPVPEHCPACGGATRIHDDNGVKTLVCGNPLCSAKKIKLLSHYVSRDAMNIDGMSEATLTKLIDAGIIDEIPDIYTLADHHDEIVVMEGFGEKSFEKLVESVERSRDTTLPKLIYSLGIPNVGASNAKLICKHFGDSLEAIREAKAEEYTFIEGVGEVIAASIRDFLENEHNQRILEGILANIRLEKREATPAEGADLSGKVFVITGSLTHFTNRNELKDRIEALGGKVTGSVSAKTDYLINNDIHSTSGKNKKAGELGIPVISEEDFLAMI